MSFRDADPDPHKMKELLDRELTAEERLARRGERSEEPGAQPPAAVLVARRALAKGATPAEVRDSCELRQDLPRERLASRPATEPAQLDAVPRESRLQRALQVGDCLSLDDFFEKGSKRPQLTTIIDGTGSRTYTWDEQTGNPTLLEAVPLEPVRQATPAPAATKEVIKTPAPQQ